MAGNLKRVMLGAAVLLLCVGILCACTDYGSQAKGTGSSDTESQEESSTAEEGAASEEVPSEVATDRHGYYNEAEDGVSKRY